MGALAIAELVLRGLKLLNVGAGEAVTFYNTVMRPANPDLPLLTDAQVIDLMGEKFTGIRDTAQIGVAQLRLF